MIIKIVYIPSDIINDMKNEYDISINYMQAYKSKEKVLEYIRGKLEKSY